MSGRASNGGQSGAKLTELLPQLDQSIALLVICVRVEQIVLMQDGRLLVAGRTMLQPVEQVRAQAGGQNERLVFVANQSLMRFKADL